MRNKPETLHEYNIPRLNWWFLWSGLAFLACLVLMIWMDYSGGELRWLGLRGDRQWKRHQAEFYRLEKKRLALDARAAAIRANEAGLAARQAELATTRQELAARKDEEKRLAGEAEKLRAAADLVTREFTMQKATRDEYRSFYEAALQSHALNPDASEVRQWRAKTEAQNARVADLERKKELADLEAQRAEETLQAVVGRERELQRKIDRLEESARSIAKSLKKLEEPLVRLPLVEFAASPFQVEQIVAETHHVDVNFVTVPRVDRCVTCHKAIDRKDPSPEEAQWRAKHNLEVIEWSTQPQPLRSHPRLDLFVGDNSPHPAAKYGCSVCHWGWDRETDFSRAGHTPNDEAQKAEWKRKHRWQEQEFLAQPMRARRYVEASCLKCHTEQTNLPGAQKLDHGRRLIGQLGCWGCHKMKQLETYTTHRVEPGEDFDGICNLYDVDADQVRRLNNLPRNVSLAAGQELSIPARVLRKDGPSLYKLAGKSDVEWVRKWLANPVAFKPNTYMPRFWGLENNTDPDRDATEINAITEYLFAVSQTPDLPAPPVAGDPERGSSLVNQVGCTACHVVEERLMDLKSPPVLAGHMDDWAYRRARTQGPQLAGVGNKTSVNWLYSWLKDPKQHHPRTKMPDMRLSDQEAADIAAYLAGLHNTGAVAAGKPSKLAELTLEYLQVTLPRQQAEAKLNQLDDLIEVFFADEETAKYFEDPARLAREEAQQKAAQKEYEESFEDAAKAKADRLASEIDQVKARMAEARQRVRQLTVEQKQNVYLGAKLIARYGCFACHDIRGFENAKPIGTELSEWGSKAVSKLDFGLLPLEHDRIAWLQQKLRAPRAFDTGRIGITRSPQELLKMPKFNLTDEQLDQIVTFVSGMTDEKLTAQEPRQLSPAEFHIERGRWLLKELNCVACHTVEGAGGALRATIETAGMEPPMLSGASGQLRQGQRTQPDWLFNFLKAPVTGEVRPWLKARMPTFGLSDAEANLAVKYFALEGRAQFPYQTPKLDWSQEHLAAGHKLFDRLQCSKCHIVEGRALGKPLAEVTEQELAQLAPDLKLAYRRLQRDWIIHKWLPDPGAQVPGTRMPLFEYGPNLAPDIAGGDGLRQREAITDHILSLGAPATNISPSSASPR
jgi:cytochrome c2